MDGIADHFPAKNVRDCRSLRIQNLNNFFSAADTAGVLQKRSVCLDPLGSPAFPLFLFCERTTASLLLRVIHYEVRTRLVDLGVFGALAPQKLANTLNRTNFVKKTIKTCAYFPSRHIVVEILLSSVYRYIQYL